MLAVEPLRQLLFWQARRLIIRTAEGRGIAWRQRREQLRRDAEPLLAASTSPSQAVPAYSRILFHAYDEGNLCWAAACEAEQATDSIALRGVAAGAAWGGEGLLGCAGLPDPGWH